jgi:hypothetical protein
MKHKKYEIETLEQFLDIVTDENFERLTIDFVHWLSYNKAVFDKVRNAHPEETKDKLNSQIAKTKFVWVDDGKTGITSITLINETTGEKKSIKPLKP